MSLLGNCSETALKLLQDIQKSLFELIRFSLDLTGM